MARRTSSARRRNNGAMPPGFDAFDVFDDIDDAPKRTIPESMAVLKSMKRDDVITVGKTKWKVMRVTGSFSAYVYKHPSKARKLYTLQAAGNHDEYLDKVEVIELDMGGRHVKTVATGALRSTESSPSRNSSRSLARFTNSRSRAWGD